MNRKLMVIGAAAVGVIGLGGVLWLRSGPDPSQFTHLTAPRFTHMDSQRMLVVETVGDPSVVSGKAIELLFKAYFKADGVSRMHTPPAPRARWAVLPEAPRTTWVGQFGLPVSERVTSVTAVPAEAGLRVTLKTWEYGDVAEVVHIGPYNTEDADIARLQTFISVSGYQAIGEHEEEYVRGPGMIFAGDPQKYITIIRLRVTPPMLDEESE